MLMILMGFMTGQWAFTADYPLDPTDPIKIIKMMTRSGHADLTGWGKLPRPLDMKWTSSQIQDLFAAASVLAYIHWICPESNIQTKILSTVMVLGCFRTVTNGGFPISMLVFRKFPLISVPNSLVSRARWTCFQVGEWLVSEFSFSS